MLGQLERARSDRGRHDRDRGSDRGRGRAGERGPDRRRGGAALEALIFGPGDFMASMGMRALESVHSLPAMTATRSTIRCCGSWSPPGPTACRRSTGRIAAIGDLDGLARAAASVAAIGYDGKWVAASRSDRSGQLGLRARIRTAMSGLSSSLKPVSITPAPSIGERRCWTER